MLKKTMDNLIIISNINDFIFCPVSIYFHNLEVENDILIQTDNQINGTFTHQSIDKNKYSSKKAILQGISIYSEKYKLIGKIDIFNIETGVLTERKRKVTRIYDGYVFQLYAQYFCLTEMGHIVKKMQVYSIKDNKTYNVAMPLEDTEMLSAFLKTLNDIEKFRFDKFTQTNTAKCANCIYEELCSYSVLKE